MAGIDDFTPTQYEATGGGNEQTKGGGGGNEQTKGGGRGNEQTKGEAHDLVASGEITLSFGWDYDPTSD